MGLSEKEARAMVLAGGAFLKRYSAAYKALKETKEALFEYMDDNNVVDLEGVEEGSGARMVERAGNRELIFGEMRDELIIWCARNGVLKGTVSVFDKLPDETRSILQPYIGQGEGTRYVDFYFPAWGVTAQAKKETARANSKATPPPAAPPVQLRPVTIQHGPASNENAGDVKPLCPDHGISKPSKFNGGYYCTKKVGDGYCKWTSESAA